MKQITSRFLLLPICLISIFATLSSGCIVSPCTEEYPDTPFPAPNPLPAEPECSRTKRCPMDMYCIGQKCSTVQCFTTPCGDYDEYEDYLELPRPDDDIEDQRDVPNSASTKDADNQEMPIQTQDSNYWYW